MKTIKRIEYLNLVESGSTTHPHELKCNQADTITIDSIVYSLDNFLKAHRYNWKSTANGNVWYYRSDNGDEIRVEQWQ